MDWSAFAVGLLAALGVIVVLIAWALLAAAVGQLP